MHLHIRFITKEFFFFQLVSHTVKDLESSMEGKLKIMIWFRYWCILCLKAFQYNFTSFSRPSLLGSNMGNYPWLADSWPTPNLTHNSKDSVNCCSGKLDSERYYNSKSALPLTHSILDHWNVFFFNVTQSFPVHQLASSTTRTSQRNAAQRPLTVPSTAPSTQLLRTTCWPTMTPTPVHPTTRGQTHTAATQYCQTVAMWVWSRIWTSGPSSLVSLGLNMPNSNTPRKAMVRVLWFYNPFCFGKTGVKEMQLTWSDTVCVFI